MQSVLKRIFSAWLVFELVALVVVVPQLVKADEAKAKAGMEALKRLPIQDAGRIKPFDTFARESLQLVYGKESYKPAEGAPDKDRSSRPALEIVMTWFLAPQFWDDQPIIELRLAALKEALNLEKTRDRFSPRELLNNDRMGLVLQDLTAYRETKQKLTGYYQAVQRLENQLGVFQGIKQGTMLRVVPPKPEAEGVEKQSMTGKTEDGKTPVGGEAAFKEPARWVAASDLPPEIKEKFAAIARAFVRALPGADTANLDPGEGADLESAVRGFQEAARAENPGLYPDGKEIGLEVHYEELHPFRLAWIFYVLSAIAVGIAWQSGRSGVMKAGWGLAILAFVLHTYGFLVRMYLTGRPPVSNMYESVIWVSWGTMLFAFIFERKQKLKFILLAGTIVATFCNIVADKAPHVLDASLQPLEPVLRSNLWLTVHVLTITISYSAFFLAWALGNMALVFLAKGDTPKSERFEAMTVSIYRCMQVGVVLLAAGTILGGVWADYSWGRFWGWDPKETWALIALLGYIALLHARLSGWIRQLGLVIGAVISFNLVIMAWYGVNYVLGAGLHSYGFGAGGVEYVTGFVLANMAFVGYAYASSRARLANA